MWVTAQTKKQTKEGQISIRQYGNGYIDGDYCEILLWLPQ